MERRNRESGGLTTDQSANVESAKTSQRCRK